MPCEKFNDKSFHLVVFFVDYFLNGVWRRIQVHKYCKTHCKNQEQFSVIEIGEIIMCK